MLLSILPLINTSHMSIVCEYSEEYSGYLNLKRQYVYYNSFWYVSVHTWQPDKAMEWITAGCCVWYYGICISRTWRIFTRNFTSGQRIIGEGGAARVAQRYGGAVGRGHRQELQDVGSDGDAAGGSVGAESGAARQMADSGDAAKIQTQLGRLQEGSGSEDPALSWGYGNND